MAEEPDYIARLKEIKFQDHNLEALRRELIAGLESNLRAISIVWAKIEKYEELLNKAIEDPALNVFPNLRFHNMKMEEINYYKRLRQEELETMTNFIANFAEHMQKIEQNGVSFEEVVEKAREIISDRELDGDLKDTLKRRLRNEFEPEIKDKMINEVIKKLEEERD